MNSRIHIRHLAAVVIAAVVALFAAHTSTAQLIFTNPPCQAVKLVNNHPTCTAQVRLVTIPAGIWPALITLPPAGAGVLLPVPVGGVTVPGVIDFFGVFTPFNPPPSTLAACGPNAWWITNILLAPLASCRFSICADSANCSITVF